MSDMFVSLRGALAYVRLTQVWLMVYVVPLQRVQEPTNLQVRRLNAITGKFQPDSKKLIYQAMTQTGEVDLRSDSGHRRLDGDADTEIKGRGIRGANLLRRGRAQAGKPVVHLVDAHCKSH